MEDEKIELYSFEKVNIFFFVGFCWNLVRISIDSIEL